MAKKKEQPKPIFPLKHEFYESLDHLLQQAINLMQAVDQAIELGAIKAGPVADMLRDRSTAMRKAMSEDA